MGYKSKRPSKERKRMYEFMERHKVSGTVSGRKLGGYIEKKGYRLEPRGSKQGEHSFGVLSKRGTEIMRGGVHKTKKRVKMWYVP